MVHNLEKKVKGCFKRRVSVTLAILTVFAITGSVGFAENLKEDYKEDDITTKTLLVPHTNREKVAEAFNKTNKQVNENTKAIDELKKSTAPEELKRLEDTIETEISRSIGEDLKHNQQIAENREGLVEERKARRDLQAALEAEIERSKAEEKRLEDTIETEISRSIGEDLKHNQQIAENREGLVEERKARKAADEALQAALDAEIERSKAEDEKHDEGIEANKDAIQTEIAERTKAVLAEENARKKADEALQAALDAEIERSEAKDKEHDEGIAANKKAIEDEVARSTAKDDEHDKGIADNKEAIETEVERSKAKDKEHDEGIAANKKAIEDEVARSTAKDDEHDKGIAANKKAIEDEVTRSTAKDKEHDEGIAANKKAIEDEVARSTTEDLKHDKGIADNKKAIEELRRDSEEGIASVAAMSVLDFKGAPVGRVGIGAAIGGYRGKQAVAVGMAFAPSENLNFTGKVGLSTDDIRNSAYGVGVNYFF
ncbi:YadA C-terminal domain-containing protein [Fusobacterium necrophorum]|uniref:YadA C-terminal domain-containing protein n=1 Tax=Fusobacterium necrophorum TaxID=859 RepID=UPI00370F62B5